MTSQSVLRQQKDPVAVITPYGVGTEGKVVVNSSSTRVKSRKFGRKQSPVVTLPVHEEDVEMLLVGMIRYGAIRALAREQIKPDLQFKPDEIASAELCQVVIGLDAAYDE